MKMEQVLAVKESRLEYLELKIQHQVNIIIIFALQSYEKYFIYLFIFNQGILEAQVTRLETEVNQMKAQAIRAQEFKQQEPLFTAQQSRSYNATSLRQGTNKLPKSCVDLKIMGHSLSGMFLIKGVKTVETVFCDFTLASTDPSKFQ